jgi:hypothetical protein
LRALLINISQLEPSAGRWLAVLALVLLLAATVLTLDLWIVDRVETFKAGDFFQFWAAGRAILQGDDPYDARGWREIYEQEGRWRWQTDQRTFLYPLWTAYPFVPLALLPVSTALLVWTLTSEGLLFVSVVLLTKVVSWTSHNQWLLLTLATALAFEPVSLTVIFGQLGIVLLSLVAGSLYLASRGRYAPAGVLLALTVIKPQLFLLVYPVLIVTMILQRRWSFLAAFATTVAALFVSSWLLVPHWIGAWQAYVGRSATVRLYLSPTIWGASHSVAAALHREDLWPIVGISALAALLGILASSLFARRTVMAESGTLPTNLSLSLLASLLIAPYVLSYDFVLLLLPICTCFWIAHPLAQPIRLVLVTSILGCAVILPWALLVVSLMSSQETASVVVPLLFFVILLAAEYGRIRTHGLPPLPNQARPHHLDGTSGGTVCPL